MNVIEAQIREDYQVKDYIYESFHLDKVAQATKDLIQIIVEDDKNTEPIKMITSNYKDGVWTVWAVLANDKPYKYAIYIQENGWVIADGF